MAAIPASLAEPFSRPGTLLQNRLKGHLPNLAALVDQHARDDGRKGEQADLVSEVFAVFSDRVLYVTRHALALGERRCH